jgi:hypothetical protein
MAKRRTVPLFDLLTRPDPNAGVQAGNVPAPQPPASPAAQGVPTQRPAGMPKPVVRLAVPTASHADAAHMSDEVDADAGGTTETSTAAPAIQVEAKPKFAPREAAHKFVGSTSTIQAAPPPATIAASEAAEQWAGRELRVPKLGLYIVLFLVGCGALIVWGVAYKLGFTSGKQSTEDLVRRDPPAVVEPGPQETPKPNEAKGLGNLGLVSPEPMAAPTAKEPPRVLSKSAPSGADDIKMPAELGPGRYDNPGTWTDTLTTNGWVVTDPRVSGLNYLWLGNMPRQDAGEAVEFLGLNGVEAFATPVENSARGAKDSDPVQTYRVWAGPGLSGADLRSNKDEPLEKRIERLGQYWSTQAKKRYDFRKPQWVKYEAK